MSELVQGSRFPLFQTALANMPNFGGMAPPPEAQQGVMPQAPQANMRPGAGAEARLKEIDGDLQQFGQLVDQIMQMQPERKEDLPWMRRLRIATGKEMEPERQLIAMKSEALQKVYGQVNTLLEERRLLTQPSAEQEDALFKAQDRQRRTTTITEVNRLLVAAGKSPIPPEIEAQFIEAGYGLDKAADSTDPLTGLKKKLDIGAAGGAEFLPEADRPIGRAGEREKKREESTRKGGDDEEGKFGGFKTFAQAASALRQETVRREQSLQDQLPYTVRKDPLSGEVLTYRESITPQAQRQARSEALRALGLEAFFPKYVDAGATEPPKADAATPQEGVKPVTRTAEELKAILAERKKAAGK